MLSLRARSSKSWLDPRYCYKLSADLSERLIARCRGEKGVFLTLTYRRDEWDDPQQLYRAASDERHVRRFMERLGQLMDQSFSGRWLCKLEFQEGGWIHFHIILLGLTYIDHAMVAHAWGHGFVWIDRLNAGRIRYICKYVAKGGEVPAYLLIERIRSVKIVRVSPGFWGELSQPSRPREPSERLQTVSAYIPIGQVIERGDHESVIRDEDTGRIWRVHENVGRLVFKLALMGCRVVGTEKGWCQVKGATARSIQAAVRNLRTAGGAAAGGGPGFHLTDTRDPPASSWFLRYFSGTFMQASMKHT